MTQEEKQLLLEDLSNRLRHGVMVQAQYKDGDGWKTEDRKVLGLYEDGQVYLNCVYTTIDCVKPYLRPMSNMTEKEKEDIKPLFLRVWTDDGNRLLVIRQNRMAEYLNYLYSHHLDFRGLIPMGLALEAPEGMYNIK